MRITPLLLALCLLTPIFAQEPEPDPARVPTKPAEAPDEVSGAVIIVSYKDAVRALPDARRTKEEAKARADEAQKKARAKGSNFFELVEKYSDEPGNRGELGVIPVGQCSILPLEAALTGMEFGQVSDVFDSDLGYLVVMRLSVKAAALHVLVAYKGAERAAAGITRTKEEAKALAEKALKRITDGEEFAKVAGELSDCPSKARGGDLGTFVRGQMAPAFEDTAFSLAPGQVSGIVETPFGFHVIKGGKVVVPVTWRASHILIRWKGTERCPPTVTRTREEAQKMIDDLLKQLKDGGDFAKLARENSDCPSKAKGGDLGVFGPGGMVPPFEKALVGLEVGQLSGVVETSFGFHVIKRTK